MDKTKNEAIRIYTAPLHYRIQMGLALLGLFIFLVIWWAFMPPAIFRAGNSADFHFFLFFLFLLVACPLTYGGLLLYLDIFHARLLIFEAGIEYQCGRMRLFVRWENLWRFEVISGKIVIIHLRVKERKEIYNPVGKFLNYPLLTNELSLANFEPDVPMLGWLRGRKIDLERFKLYPLGADLYHYAPQLFESDEKAKS